LTFAGNVLIALASLVNQLVLARAMGVEQYGVYAYTFTWIVVLALPAKLGFDTGSVRFVALYAAQGDRPRLKGFLKASGAYVAVSAVLLALAATWASHGIGAGLLERGAAPAFAVAVLLLPLYALQLTRSGAAQGFRQVWLSQTAELVRLMMTAALVAAAAWVFRRRVDAPAALLLQGAAIALALGTLWIGLWVKVRAHWRGVTPLVRNAEWFKVSVPLMLVSATHLIMKRTDVLMLGAMVSPAVAGAYQVASRFADLMVFGLAAANTFAAPMMSELHALGRMTDLRRVARLTARVGAVTTLIALVVLVASAGLLLRLFGPGFDVARPALIILAGAQLVNALAGSVGILMSMTGHQNAVSVVLAFAAALNVGLNFVLIPRYGLVGAAVATGLATVAWNVTLAVMVRRRLGIRSTAF
jgi:O-antigen/teichoic acid export membrane protein